MVVSLIQHDTGLPAAETERRRLERAVLDRYRVNGLLTRGGMAAVYRGVEIGLDRPVALKVLAETRARDADERGRFRREARILASLAHPGIVPVLGTGESAGTCWFAMPLLAGGTLAARLERERRIGHEEARAMLADLADALTHAHARGVVHRDLKAENVLLDELGKPVIADFGVAILSTSDHSRAETTRGYGTPEYMSPEQFLGAIECDGRQDLYALGVLGFRMLTGRFPFEGTAEQIAAAHVTREVPPVAAYASEVPPDLAAAIDRCLAKRPRDRWKSCAALRDALRARAPAGGAGWLRRISLSLRWHSASEGPPSAVPASLVRSAGRAPRPA